MGSALCTMFRQRPVRVFYYGLDAAGKTTLLYRLKLGEVVTTIPTIGFNVETLNFNGVEMMTWDVGIREKGRPLIAHYMHNTDAVVFIVDSTDHDRLHEAVDEFFQFVYPTVQERQLPILVLANKQDKEKIMSPDQIKAAIFKKGGEAFRVNTDLEVFPTVALTLEGVNPALEWLTTRLALTIARDSYFPSFSMAKIKQYPVSFLKSTYHRVSGLVYGEESVGTTREESVK